MATRLLKDTANSTIRALILELMILTSKPSPTSLNVV